MEALRILAFVMIVTDHVSWSGVTLVQTNDPTWFFALFINIWSRFGVDLFVLIGAFFLCTKTLETKGIVKRWWAILYPVAILLGAIYIIAPPISSQQMLNDAMSMFQGTPVAIQGFWLGHLWFIYPYLILIAISPILNYAINAMGKENHKKAMIGLSGMFILVPTINAVVSLPFLYTAGGPILSFIALYFVASYIRKYDVRIAPMKGAAIAFAMVIAVFAITLLYTLVLKVPTPESPNGTNTYFLGDSILPVFVGSIFLFLTFRSMDLKNKLISLSGKLTYEAYLVHPVVWSFVMIAWPVSYFSPNTGTSIQIVGTIIIVTGISFGYSLSRYLMDLSLVRMFKEVKLAASSEMGVLGRIRTFDITNLKGLFKG